MISCRILVLFACFAGLNAGIIRTSFGGSKCPVVSTKANFEIEKVIQQDNLSKEITTISKLTAIISSISVSGTKSPNSQISFKETCTA